MKYRTAGPANTRSQRSAGNGSTVRCYFLGEGEFQVINNERNAGWLPSPGNDGRIKLCLDGKPVTICFSKEESFSTKDKVRDILTEAYEEKIQRIVKQSFSDC